MATLTPPHIQQDGREGGGKTMPRFFNNDQQKKRPSPLLASKGRAGWGGGSKDNASKINSVSITINKRSASHIMQHALHRK